MIIHIYCQVLCHTRTRDYLEQNFCLSIATHSSIYFRKIYHNKIIFSLYNNKISNNSTTLDKYMNNLHTNNNASMVHTHHIFTTPFMLIGDANIIIVEIGAMEYNASAVPIQ